MNELRRDFGRLVIDATSKVTGKVLDDGDQKRINEETAGQVAL
jgi:F-type H+-transporting ATPase subunit b